MNTERINEMVCGMDSFSKEKYSKGEILDEMIQLEHEMIKHTFGNESENYKLRDVGEYYKKKNQEMRYVASEELTKFINGSRKLHCLLKAEISGRKGEEKAFAVLDTLNGSNVVLKNVELREGELKTEIDALVITPKCVTIIEVKNTSKDVYINETGNYYRTGEFLKWDSNLGEKMSLRERMLKNVLSRIGYDWIEIKSVVVFTDNRIEVHNKYKSLKTCFIGQLIHIIRKNGYNNCLSDKDINVIGLAIKDAEQHEEYPFGFNVEQYKRDYATLVVKLSEAQERRANSLLYKVICFFNNKASYVAGTAAVF